MNLFTSKKFLGFLARFLITFCLLYYGTIAIIGIATPGGFYSRFIDLYFDYYRWARSSLMYASQFTLSVLGFDSEIIPPSYLLLKGGRGANIGYDCLGYGVVSFWLAFVFANHGSILSKLKWMLAGAVALWIINVARITFILLAINKGWRVPFGWNHHTWFNVVAYACIFFMMYLFDRDKQLPKSAVNDETSLTSHPSKYV